VIKQVIELSNRIFLTSMIDLNIIGQTSGLVVLSNR